MSIDDVYRLAAEYHRAHGARPAVLRLSHEAYLSLCCSLESAQLYVTAAGRPEYVMGLRLEIDDRGQGPRVTE